MNISEYSLRNKVISWLFVVLLLVGGSISFTQLGQLEFPEFPIPQAMVNTVYPGASPEQVEEEVTLPIEKAIQQLEYVKHISSVSSAGVSQIEVELKETFPVHTHPQIWDEMRRKVDDIQSQLPPGVMTSVVNDDFGDVFGIMLNISGEGYSYRDLENYADFLRRELSLVKDVKKVNIAGEVREQVLIEISQAKMAALNLDPSWIFGLLQNQNVVSNAGDMLISGQKVRIHPTGEFMNIRELENLLVSLPGSSELIYLGDIASISRDYDETPMSLYRSNGQPALSLGISFAKNVNVVDVGRAIDARLAEMEPARPVGLDLTTVYNQPDVVDQSVSDFLVSLVEAVAIVIVVLMFAMGLRSGLIMAAILLLTIFGTFIGMWLLDVNLQLISLGALVIALGMLVDNAIVITEGVLVGLQRGQSRLEAIRQVVKHQQWPLLGATVIAIIAFAPIGLSPDLTGDFMKSLFTVLCISLIISWVLAITLTPFFCNLFFKEAPTALIGDEVDPYKGLLFTIYRKLLQKALTHRIISISLTGLLLVVAVIGFGNVKQAFFPPSNTPIFFVDLWFQEGTDIRQTSERVAQIEQEVMKLDDVLNVTSVMGMGAQRFILTYMPEKVYSSYGQLIVEAENLETVKALIPEVYDVMDQQHDVEYKIKLLQNGPTPIAGIEARFYGPDPAVLRKLGAQAIAVMEAEPGAMGVRHTWREKQDIVRPVLDEAAARRSGISKKAIDQAMLVNFSGMQVGLYRDGSHMLPIIARAPDEERLNADSISDLQIWSQERNSFVPVSQAVTGFETETENPLVQRRDLRRMLAVMADPSPLSDDTPESIRLRLKEKIEAIPLPDGYTFEWGGEKEMSEDAQTNLFSSLPMGYLSMFLITIFLFGTIRQPLAIWATVPLAVIGVSAGLLLLNKPFTFTALLGLLSLSGMLVKNGIVLVEQINIEARKDITIQAAILEASISRVRPVCMAALTTMLGMIPLVFDAFFSSMAVTIIFGLGFATVLTLVVLPVIYLLLHRIRFDQGEMT
ncbi:efflux RND transporter permease subunit [Sansalvadorimonas sp. 2012CJ34-2]|uniref:Efflux RND transporter permease subunit n=1 Tax=Parendozoicomonas callyspongiae TaxID=2942213 RepID=A0ABT0PN26_9GAMM|nr:efflux RND transporter permease subunit [Sansalvadorimonas sp. 2012CJ34-2]MCL6272137.1 efflux RND transporter permease subunit [Sansalvadorimonas sp. 2012CJ34-2]